MQGQLDATTETLIELSSPFDFPTALERCIQAIKEAGLTLFAKIDHAEAALEIGLKMPSTVVLVYGSPKGGTPVMLAHPQSALDLPLRALLREAPDGTTLLAFHPIVTLLTSGGAPVELVSRLEPAQMLLAEAITPEKP